MWFYRLSSTLLSPLLPFWMMFRALKGKEDMARLMERFAVGSLPRPSGKLMWIHAASVGEANSVLLLIERLHKAFPALALLLTTGTVTSARLMAKRLPTGVVHQFAPLDTPSVAHRFMQHWRPDFALWVESEIWPNLIEAANRRNTFLGIINGRMSERSFTSWQRFPRLIRRLLSRFDIVIAQTPADRKRFKALGARNTFCLGNLKYDAAMLPCDEAELVSLKAQLGDRPVWLAASTHPGEEAQAANIHAVLAARRPNLLTIVVPRHPERGPEIARALSSHGKVSLRSASQPIAADTRFYIADTLGELGLFYRLSPIVFMGGSLVAHGGQNPLEPARLSCAILSGPHVENFADIYRLLEKQGAVLRATSGANAAVQLDRLMGQPEVTALMQAKARKWVASQSGAAERLLSVLRAMLGEEGSV